jgi:hypothetical protein
MLCSLPFDNLPEFNLPRPHYMSSLNKHKRHFLVKQNAGRYLFSWLLATGFRLEFFRAAPLPGAWFGRGP